ncbi:plexin domain-containing protein 2 [Tribolium castaneum]|uniref:Plexin domain-containing protein 2-like Protein n=1 Tax=Tribolium castaneum TaxID=7070 RepID=D6WNK8_TRICA|nr:PREDICTED: plexin domain-containing protein 2 [Tribolium castaneum]EFA03767.1 Plexin domain-containing protein 2-like Protein [Tribolium castaneum]|eukprot:XP_967978.1 PREDICTED: plexin domain-containing protein 2 [Tribolium castaneum]
MAKICVVCGSLCAYFILFLSTVALCSENAYYYETDFQDDKTEYVLSKQLLEEVSHRFRRDAQIENNQSNARSQNTTQPVRPNDTNVAQSQSGSSSNDTSSNKTQTDNKISTAKTKLGKTTKVATSVNTTKIQDSLQKNLGENGTGIRKNVTTDKPKILSNQTVDKSVLQNITLPKNETDDELAIDSFPPDANELNKTLEEHHITNSTEDTHLYYNSSLVTDPELGRSLWVDLENSSDTKVNELLSRSHRRAATVQLSFEFPFYGHLIKNVTIATGGFLYTGDYVHSWLAATQYIAPLMANFDTSISNDSFIKYVDNGTAFTVEWEKVVLQDKANEGEFTFQTTLHKNGDIVFVYKNVPLIIKNITDNHHPVKVGLSDAYIIDRTIFLVRRKTIYEYHRINFVKGDIRNWTVIYLTALPTCLQNEDCLSCVTKDIATFQCFWCPIIKRCSNGVDRNRQDWLANHCQTKKYNESICSHISGADIFDASNITYVHDANEFQRQLEEYNNASVMASTQPVRMGVSSIVAILFLIAMVSGLAVWILYAYRNPHTTSGQILIRYRPSQWRWRRGEARYTAATIHM